MDLFVSLPDCPYSLEHLEILYKTLESASLTVPGTLNIVRGARVPIIKYMDVRGSGMLPLRDGCIYEASKSTCQ